MLRDVTEVRWFPAQGHHLEAQVPVQMDVQRREDLVVPVPGFHEPIRQLAHDRASTWEISKAAVEQGTRTLREDGVLANATAPQRVRMVTHYGISAEDVESTLKYCRRAVQG